MSERKNLVDAVEDFISDLSNDDEAVELVSELYQMVIELARENGSLELENSLLTRQIDIAESYIMHLEEDEPLLN